MKIKSLLIAVLFASGFFLANAQVVENGNKILNLGVGLGNALYSGGGYTGSVPPISGSLEVVIKDDLFDGKGALGVGGYLGYAAYKWAYSGLVYGAMEKSASMVESSGIDYGWKYSNIIIGPRGYLHYNLVENLDTYIGAMLGYNIVSSKWYGTGTSIGTASSGGVIFSGFIGARYFFSEKLGGFVELGSGIAYLNLGVAINL